MLSIKGFSLATGIMWAVFVGWCFAVAILEVGIVPYEFVNQSYFGLLQPDIVGLVIGTAIGFIDGLIGGAVFAWIYNAIGGKRVAAK